MQIIKLLLKLFGVWFLCWVLGSISHAIYCIATVQDSMVPDCSIQTAFFSFVILMPVFPVLYLPALFGLRWLLRGVKPFFLFPIVSTLLVFILGMRILTNFHVVLFTTSFLFGLGFVWILNNYQESISALENEYAKIINE